MAMIFEGGELMTMTQSVCGKFIVEGGDICEGDIDHVWGSITSDMAQFQSGFYVWGGKFNYVLSFCLFLHWFDSGARQCVQGFEPME
jgi:hypothetical protein